MRAELARGDAVALSVVPILRHLLANDDSSVFSDDILARVRGMLDHVARQLLHAMQEPSAVDGPAAEPDQHAILRMSEELLADAGLLTHLHAVAIEWQLTERLEGRLGLDPVVPPLLQALVASPEDETQGLAMKMLAAQARWCQCQRRMQLPLYDLPGERLHAALLTMRALAPELGIESERAAFAEAQVRSGFDEGACRLGLAARLILDMGGGAIAAMDIEHAGVALFLTAVAMTTEQPRETVALSTHEGQAGRLALALRGAGLKVQAIERQMHALHPNLVLPEGFERMSVDHAAAVLASGRFAAP